MIAYPGRDPLEFTITVFEALYTRCAPNKKLVDGRWESKDEHDEMVRQDNAKIFMRARFPTYYPDPFAALDELE